MEAMVAALDGVKGKVVQGTKPGPKPLLSIADETEL